MRIGILGSGLMAGALGGQWVRAGHEVMVGGRSRAKSAALAAEIGAVDGTPRQAAGFGAVTLLAVSSIGVDEMLRSVGAPQGSLAGRPLIDCTNALVSGRFMPAEAAVAERVAATAVGAQVVKAFNHCADSVWRAAPQPYEGLPLGVPLCGDDDGALEQVAGLVRDLGCVPVPAGGLERAAVLEATAIFSIGVWAAGGDVRSLFPTLDSAFGTVPATA